MCIVRYAGMTFLFLAAVVLSSAVPCWGQGNQETETVLLEEHFEQWTSASGPPGWSVLYVDQGVLWKSSAWCDKGIPNNTGGTGKYADANSDCIGWRFFDSTLVTPEFSLAGQGYTSAKLVYKTCLLRWVSWYATAEVGLTTDGGATTVSLLKYPEKNFDHWTETIDLTPYLGQAHVRVGFKYGTINVDSYWQVDDVFVIASTGGGGCSVQCTASAAATAPVNSQVLFTSTATPANCTAAPSFIWNFGDGQVSAEQNPVHTYTAAGAYNWTMAASADGVVCNKNGAITVTASDTCLCTGDINCDNAVNVGDMVQLKRCILQLDTGAICARADVNGDGAANVGDSVQIRRYILGLDNCQ